MLESLSQAQMPDKLWTCPSCSFLMRVDIDDIGIIGTCPGCGKQERP